MTERNEAIDSMKGILIIMVVLGHYQTGVLHDVIFLYHMPLFFIISGYLLDNSKILNSKYLKEKCKTMMLPYVIYLTLDVLLIRRNFTIDEFVHVLWGGRAISGTYWFITCFLFTMLLFSFLLRHFSVKQVKILIFICGCIACIESHISENLDFLASPGIPGNIDVALLALVYVGVGFFCKGKINNLIEGKNKKWDSMVVGTLVFLIVVFCVSNMYLEFYSFDMKKIYYKELFLAILIPCSFGIVLIRCIHCLINMKKLEFINSFLIMCGRCTIPIMYMHVPLNTLKEYLEYGIVVYFLIGVGVPLLFARVFCRFKMMRKYFGLSLI